MLFDFLGLSVKGAKAKAEGRGFAPDPICRFGGEYSAYSAHSLNPALASPAANFLDLLLEKVPDHDDHADQDDRDREKLSWRFHTYPPGYPHSNPDYSGASAHNKVNDASNNELKLLRLQVGHPLKLPILNPRIFCLPKQAQR